MLFDFGLKWLQRIFDSINGTAVGNSDNRQGIAINLRSGKKVKVGQLFSERNYNKNARPEGAPEEWQGENIGRGQENNTDIYQEQIGSTAINNVEYDPNTEECWVSYNTNPNKKYHFVNMSKGQFQAYMNAGSKGQYTQAMRVANHDPAYPVTLHKKS